MQRTRPRLRPEALSVAFVAGAVLGTLWDQFHVISGTLRYAEPTLAGQPWWVPLQFGGAFALAVAAFAWLGDPAPRRASPRVAGIETIWMTAVYATTAFLSDYPWALAVVMLVLLAARSADLATTFAASPIPAATTIVAGPLYEASLIAAGQFEYATSQLGEIPVWLPLLWVNGILFVARLTDALMQRFGMRRPEPEQPETS
ncbi:MAG: hypothetical protein ACRDJM_05175 [Actinomycetota bacterium]